MAEENNKVEALSKRLDELLSMHNNVSTEIDNLRVEILRLKVEQKQKSISTDPAQLVKPKSSNKEVKEQALTESIEFSDSQIPPLDTVDKVIDTTKTPERTISSEPPNEKEKKFDIEKLIGENLINKIGILVLVIGVAIFAKYSIENDLISPLTRIIFGYASGIILLGLGMYLKKNYLNFSAVLVSGAMSILYFITFFAFNFYHLIGQEVAFGLMVIFTIFTVIAALNYDKEIIAHLGLVGAVSVPFLLSNESGNALFLFSYMTLINVGIAFISLKKNWKLLFYSAFAITWIVYGTWLVLGYDSTKHFTLAFSFLTVFFILFYVIFIAYKFIKLKKYNAGDVIVLLLNSILFFGIGYALLYDHDTGNQILGAFALANAVLHFIAAYVINTKKLADRNLFYLIVGLVLSCLTLAIPIQLDGHWVTMMWSAEAVVLFFIGRSRKVAFYEYISFVLMGIASMSLSLDWESKYATISNINTFFPGSVIEHYTPIFNSSFLTSLIVIICFGIITFIHMNSGWKKTSKVDAFILKILDFAIPIALIGLIFLSFRIEILNYFHQLYVGSGVKPNQSETSFKIYDINISHKAKIWLIDYSFLYFSILSIIGLKYITNTKAKWALVGVNLVIITTFLLEGLYDLSELRENYMSQERSEYYNIDNSFVWLRYLSLGLLALLMKCTYSIVKNTNSEKLTKITTEIVLCLIILWVSTSEVIHWLDFTDRSETYGLVLSIFWGIFSVILIAIGIWKKKKHIRILGIAIFGVTLVKLFLYDLSNLKTIAKTIVMISLGALLLLTSFLYNKYKIEDEQSD